MNRQKVAAWSLRVAGILLVALGVVHLAATPHIPALLGGSPPAIYQRAIGPTLLNHVAVGILLLPLGYTTWLVAGADKSANHWAKRTLIANTIVTLTLPISLIAFMRSAVYYTAPLFLTGVGLVAIISLLMLLAAFIRTDKGG